MKIIDEHGTLNIYTVEYQDVVPGNEIIIDRKGNTSKVIRTENWKTKTSHLQGLMYRLTFENGNQSYGWANRTLKAI